jgi:DNA-binding LacI/PurR family transcriptional regulator
LFALDDTLASEAIEVCREQGWEVPGEISVIGAGNLEIACECSHIPISSVDTREAEVACRAAETLEQMMGGKYAQIVLRDAGIVYS